MASISILGAALVLFSSLSLIYAGNVRLTQETPCQMGQSCRLKCSLVSEANINGLDFLAGSVPIATCNTPTSCTSLFPGYTYTRQDASTSFLDIQAFNSSVDVGTWLCRDGGSGSPSNISLVENTVPSGVLKFGDTCGFGVARSPASLTCSGLLPGVPPASLTLKDSSGQTVGSSQTGSVTGTVTRGGQASCSVSWSALPSYTLNISPAQCHVHVVANVTLISSSTANGGKVITCLAEGYPENYTFQPWLQTWGGQEVRRVTGSQQGGQYNLTLTSYQDTGTYTCSVDNGVRDSQGQVIVKTSAINVSIEDSPKLPLPTDPAVHTGELGQRVLLYLTLYSWPALANFTWTFLSRPLPSSSSCSSSSSSSPATFQGSNSSTQVLLPAHGSPVQTEGVKVTLEVRARPNSTGDYSLQACNRVGCSSTAVTLKVQGPPAPPVDVTAVSVTSDSVTLTWLTGPTGGDLDRWFLVQFRPLQSPAGEGWRDQGRVAAAREEGSRVTHVIRNLTPLTAYVIRVRAQNSRLLDSAFSREIIIETKASAGLSKEAGLAVAVVVTFVLTLGGTLLLVFLVLRYRRRPGAGRENKESRHQDQAAAAAAAAGVGAAPGEAGQPGAAVQQSASAAGREASGGEGSYSVLDPGTRLQQPVVSPYQSLHLGQNQPAPRNHGDSPPDEEDNRAIYIELT